MRYTFLSILFSFSAVLAFGQNVKLKGATSQSWAGGVCCATGVNYVITLESTDTASQLKLDSVWVGDSYFVNSPANAVYMNRTIVAGKAVYNIQVRESWNGWDQEIIPLDKPVSNSPYTGEATVVCHFGHGKTQHVTVNKFTELPPIAYP